MAIRKKNNHVQRLRNLSAAALKNETSSRTIDVVTVARCLGLKLKFVSIGED